MARTSPRRQGAVVHAAPARRWRYRADVASRTLAAVAGGYGLSALATVWLARALPGGRLEATQWATMVSFFIYTAAALWCFTVRNSLRAWLGLALSTLLLVTALWLQGSAA